MRDTWRHFVAEFVGTFALVFIGGGTIITSPLVQSQATVLSVALAHGLILALLVSATMNISGGHLNPAVTTGFLVTRRIDPMMAVIHWIAQFLGAIIAAYMLKALFPVAVTSVTLLGGQRISSDTTLLQAVVLEAVATFFLVFVVFGTAVDPRGPKLGGMAIGLTVAADILAIGPLTGGSMNPARSFGPAVVTHVFEGQTAYWVGPIIGGIVAALLYDRLFLRDGPPTASAT
ncbi:MAG TPA: aquaporin [Gemmatimonadaceae bacterium]|jgi:MIP family channel proteins|nr:aquaporin [Gemmatimonadaceae bacterium]